MEFEEQDEAADQTTHELSHSHPPPSYDSVTLNNNNGNSSAFQAARMSSTSPLMQLDSPSTVRKPCRYRECLKNHAVGLGVHAVDGCCEFMPAGDDGTLDALKCAACNCHRNFHRKELNPNYPLSPHIQQHQHQHFVPYYRSPSGYLHMATPTQQRPLALPSSSGGGMSSQEQEENMTSSGGHGLLRKRQRTKFTAEQKEKMISLAERLGWRIQKEDDEAVKCFCEETGVSRHVLKVWMHNNKHTLGKKP